MKLLVGRQSRGGKQYLAITAADINGAYGVMAQCDTSGAVAPIYLAAALRELSRMIDMARLKTR